MTPSNRRPTEPGEILFEDFLRPRSISIAAFARAADVSRKHMSGVVHGKVRIEASLASRIGRVLGTSAEVWLGLQNAVDLYDAKTDLENWQPETVYTGDQYAVA